MTKPSIQQISDKLDNVMLDIVELKHNKADKEIIILELLAIKKDVISVQTEQSRVNSYGKWVVFLIAGALISALLNLVLAK